MTIKVNFSYLIKITTLLCSILIISNQSIKASENHDMKEINNVIQIYFESMYESSSDKVYKAFHPNAKISGYLGVDFAERTVDEFAALVASVQPSEKKQNKSIVLEVLSIDIAGNTAVARVRDSYRDLIFLDTLSFIKIDNEWKIYNKLFHVES